MSGEAGTIILFLIYYGLAAKEDLYHGEISLKLLLGFTAAGAGWGIMMSFFDGTQPVTSYTYSEVWGVMMSVCPGMFLLAMNKLSRGSVGEGDGYFLLSTVFYLKTAEIWILAGGSILVSGIVGTGILIRKAGKNWKQIRIPLLPCMFPLILLLGFIRIQQG